LKQIQISLLILLSLLFLDLVWDEENAIVPKTLEGKSYTSQFYHYCNYYHFKTDSTGFSESGQVAWSCPVDTISLGISGDEILYAYPQEFKYKIKDTTLTIEYLIQESDEDNYQNVFYFRPKYNDWISEYEYAYGKECLKVGEKKGRFEY